MELHDDDAIDRLLRALADTTRRRLLDRLRDAPGLTQGQLGAGFALTRQALSKHLAALETAGLVVALWRGREKLHYLDPAPLLQLPSFAADAAAAAALQQALSASRRAAVAADPVSALLEAPPPPATRAAVTAQLDAVRAWLASGADAVVALAAALPADAGYGKPAPGVFSIAEHVWHLADLETLGWTPRFQRALAERRPRLPGVDGDRLAVAGRYQQRPWRGAARRFVAQRKRTLRSLARLDAALLQRPLVFAGRAATVADMLAAMVAHDHEHRAAMAQLWSDR